MEVTEVKRHSFKVHPEGVIKLVRQAYWMEERVKWAFDTLRCFQGITLDQSQAILEGDAYLTTTDGGITATYVDEVDKEWKKELTKFLKWTDGLTIEEREAKRIANDINEQIDWLKDIGRRDRKHVTMEEILVKIQNGTLSDFIRDIAFEQEIMTNVVTRPARFQRHPPSFHGQDNDLTIKLREGLKDTKFSDELVEIGGRKVNKEKLEHYAGFIVARLRKAIKDPGLMLTVDPLVLYEYEMKRQELHNELCKEAGFDERDRDDKEFQIFDDAISAYLDEKAGPLFKKREA